MVDVAKFFLFFLGDLLLVKLVRLSLAEAWQEGSSVGGGVDQAVDDIVARGGHHCQLHFALATEK